MFFVFLRFMAERLVRGFSNLIATIQDRRQLTSTNNNILVPLKYQEDKGYTSPMLLCRVNQ